MIISAPAKGEDITIVMGVNDDEVRPGEAPHHLERVVHDELPRADGEGRARHFGFVRGSMVTIHSYTNDQNILDLPHKDLRRARAAALSIIPTTTGAAKATSLVIPEVKGKIDGIAIRVPTPDVSLTDLAVVVEQAGRRSTEVNAAFKAAAERSAEGHPRSTPRRSSSRPTTSATRTRASSTRRARTSSTARW